jgi:4a-hydroxytetrahydrobiopterin dehydratase
MPALATQHCTAQVARADDSAIATYLRELAGWTVSDNVLAKDFKFGNYYETMAFVNLVAWISHREDHHPDLFVGYNRCRVAYSTHSVGGLSKNDFICAARVDALAVG